MRKSAVVLLAAAVLVSFAGCRKSGNPVSNQTETEKDSTLKSLQKINDYPFYTMIYYGDYGFGESLSGVSRPPETEPNAGRFACTCFAAMGSDSSRLFGRNFDWHTHIALMLFTHPAGGYASMSMVHLPGLGYSADFPLEAPENRYALLRAPMWPLDGVNECGVAMASMMVDSVSAPYDPGKRTLDRSRVIRLVLDYAKDVDDAVALLQKYNISFAGDPLHYLVSDAAGHSAVIEYGGGSMRVTGNVHNWQVCTNTVIYGTRMPENSNFTYQGPAGWSLWRYGRVYELLSASGGNTTPKAAMNILSGVKANFGEPYNVFTMWSVVYNLKTLQADVSTGMNYADVYHVSLGNAAGRSGHSDGPAITRELP
jgi:Acyl-coenzyme A:6-aminopenicillanic acid acyl-transferase